MGKLYKLTYACKYDKGIENRAYLENILVSTNLLKNLSKNNKTTTYTKHCYDMDEDNLFRRDYLEFILIDGATPDEISYMDELVDNLQKEQDDLIIHIQENHEEQVKEAERREQEYIKKYGHEYTSFKPEAGWNSDDQYLEDHPEIFDEHPEYYDAVNK